MEKLSKITIEYLWRDRKRHLGLPLSFTRYRLSENRLFREMGVLNTREEEVLLYRVRDLELKRSLGQRLFGVGTVLVHSTDKTSPILELKNVRRPREVKELIYRSVEQAKDKRGMKATELLTGHPGHFDGEGSFEDPDDLDDDMDN